MLMSRGSGKSGVLLAGLAELSSVVESIIFCPFFDKFLSVEALLMLELIPDAVLGKEGMKTGSKRASETIVILLELLGALSSKKLVNFCPFLVVSSVMGTSSMPMSFVQTAISGIGDQPLLTCAAESNVVLS